MYSLKIVGIADAVVEAMEDFPSQDPAELVDELVKVFAADEELSHSDTERLRDLVWHLVS